MTTLSTETSAKRRARRDSAVAVEDIRRCMPPPDHLLVHRCRLFTLGLALKAEVCVIGGLLQGYADNNLGRKEQSTIQVGRPRYAPALREVRRLAMLPQGALVRASTGVETHIPGSMTVRALQQTLA